MVESLMKGNMTYTRKIWLIVIFFTFTLSGLMAGLNSVVKFYKKNTLELRLPIRIETQKVFTVVEKPMLEEMLPFAVYVEEKPVRTPIVKIDRRSFKEVAGWVGKVSYYSHDGCLGCNPNQIMSNGEAFNENAMTLAFNHLPMNTKVKVTNLDNGKSVEARVTDTGGFNYEGRIAAGIPYENNLDRLADLSFGLYNAIGAETDRSMILIEEIVELAKY